MSPPDKVRLRHWATEAWYYGRLTVLTIAALLIVGWMVVTMVVVKWPSLAGPFSSWVERTQREAVVKPLDGRTQQERWSDDAEDKNPIVETPYEYWKHHRPLPTDTMERHQRRGRMATNPSVEPRA